MDDRLIIKKMKKLIDEGLTLIKKIRSYNDSYAYENKHYLREISKWDGSCQNLLSLRFGDESEYLLK